MKRTKVRSRPLGRRFWIVWTAATGSNIGDGIVLAAVPLLAAELTRHPMSIAATTIAVRLPWLVFGLFAGVIVDRTDRLRLMISTDLGRAVAFVGIAVIVASDNITLLVLYLVMFGVGILETLFDTAAMSMTPALVETDQLERANARINGAQIAANEFVGPPIGGALFAAAAAAPFGVNAATFAASAAILLTVGGRYRPRRVVATSVAQDVKTGFSFVWQEPLIRAFAIGAGAINLGFTAAAAVLVLHAQDNLGLDGLGFGLLLASAAVGGVVGAQVAPGTISRVGRRRSVLASVVVIAGGVAVMGLATTLWVAALGFACFGFAGEIWNVVSVTYRQSVTPDELLGRVMSGFRVIAYGAFPVGAVLGGLIASVTTVRTAFFVGAGVIALLLPYLASVTRSHPLDPRT
jgi:MFS family permease